MTAAKGTFILSTERSGSSLLRVLLNEHPKIAALPETHFLPSIHKLLKSNHLHGAGSKIKRLLEKSSWFQQLELRADDRDKIWKILENHPINERLLFSTIFQGYANRSDKALWIEKTPLYSLYWQDILEIFPQARFIILTRDPFGYCNSMKRAKWFKLKPPLHFIIDRYRKYIRSLNNLIEQHPDLPIIKLDFKDLILNTDLVLASVFQFLAVEALTLEQLSGYLKSPDKHYSKEHLGIGHHERLFKPIDPGVIDEWKEELSEWEITLIDTRINNQPSKTSPVDRMKVSLDYIYSKAVWNTTGEKVLRKRF